MKKLMFWMLTSLSIIGTSCEIIDINFDHDANGSNPSFDISILPCDSGEDISIDSLPQAILDYLSSEFPNVEIEDADIFIDGDQMVYGIRLANGWEILFDEMGVVIESGDENMEIGIEIDSLFQGILDYVNNNFPGITIDSASIEVEFGDRYFEIELNNDLDLYFDAVGEFVCQDDHGNDDDDNDDDSDSDDDDDDNDDDDSDGDDDDDNGQVPSLGNLPDSVRQYLSSMFAQLDIEEVELEDLCDDNLIIKVELEGPEDEKVRVFFSLEWELLFVSRETTASALPVAVLDSLEDNYPGYTLEEDDIYEWTFPDGAIQYQLEVETDEEDYEVTIQADGTIICSES